MIKMTVKKWMLDEAEKLFQFHKLNNSITEGEGEFAGALGEVMTEYYFDYFLEKITTRPTGEALFHYDLITEEKKCRIEVKTKRTNVKPSPNYLCSIPASNTKQECDIYFFVRILNDLSKGYLLGYIAKDDFFQKAAFAKKGEDDPESENGFQFRADCYNLPISELTQPTVRVDPTNGFFVE